ncbi:A24 family peptidase [Paenibacillus psychroresistens]|nr:prepilin peptidase [Paenibacillus psychroresistens]
MIQWSLIGLITVLAFYSDIRLYIIPNWLTVSGILLGLFYHVVTGGTEGFIYSISGICVGLILLFILYLFGAIGAGDVKLFAAYGAIAGMEFVFQSLIYTLLYACLIGLVVLAIQKKLFHRMIWIFNTLFSFLIMKNWLVYKTLPSNQMLRFPLMWAVLPAIFTYSLSMKGII